MPVLFICHSLMESVETTGELADFPNLLGAAFKKLREPSLYSEKVLKCSKQDMQSLCHNCRHQTEGLAAATLYLVIA